MRKDKYYVFEDGFDALNDKGERIHVLAGWRHKTPLKCLINPILRKIQFWTKKPLVIASKTDIVNNIPHFRGYVLTRVGYLDNIRSL